MCFGGVRVEKMLSLHSTIDTFPPFALLPPVIRMGNGINLMHFVGIRCVLKTRLCLMVQKAGTRHVRVVGCEEM